MHSPNHHQETNAFQEETTIYGVQQKKVGTLIATSLLEDLDAFQKNTSSKRKAPSMARSPSSALLPSPAGSTSPRWCFILQKKHKSNPGHSFKLAPGSGRRSLEGLLAPPGEAETPFVTAQSHSGGTKKDQGKPKWLWLVPFWLVGEFTTQFRTYFSGIGMLTGGTGVLTHGQISGCKSNRMENHTLSGLLQKESLSLSLTPRPSWFVSRLVSGDLTLISSERT